MFTSLPADKESSAAVDISSSCSVIMVFEAESSSVIMSGSGPGSTLFGTTNEDVLFLTPKI